MSQYSVKNITGHPLYSDRKGEVWAVLEDGKIIATAARKTAAKGYLDKLTDKKS